MKLDVYNTTGKSSEKLDVPEDVFGCRVNKALLHQAVVKYHASNRQGTASTKERADVSGGGRKPHRQKGTGRARAGSSRSPLWIGGGVTFGPHPRDFSYSIPKKVKHSALKESLAAKFQAQDLICVNDFSEKFEKTKEFASILKGLKLKGKTLAVLDGCDESILRVSRNIPFVSLSRSQDINAYDVLRCKTLLITKTALGNLLNRVQSTDKASDSSKKAKEEPKK